MAAAVCNRCGASVSAAEFFRHKCPDPTKLLHGRPGATTGTLRQGYLLSTPETARWPAHMLEAANAREKCSLFAGFSERDQGRGRQLVAMAQRQEDARRLAACWNVCEGVDTELLEKYPAPFSKLRTERDELLTAMQRILQAPQDTMSDAKALREIVAIARTAVNAETIRAAREKHQQQARPAGQ